MDPQANLNEQLAIATAAQAWFDAPDLPTGGAPDCPPEVDFERLVELVLAMHDWRMANGFDPYAGQDRSWLTFDQLDREYSNAKKEAPHA